MLSNVEIRNIVGSTFLQSKMKYEAYNFIHCLTMLRIQPFVNEKVVFTFFRMHFPLPHITSLAFHIIVVSTFLRHLEFLVCEYFNDVVSSVKWKRTPGIINVCPKSRLGWYVYVNHQRLLYNLRIYLHACIVFVFVVVVNNRCCCCFAFVCV